MKFIWEEKDIKAGVRVEHFSGTIYKVVSVDTDEAVNVGFSLLHEEQNRVGPTHPASKFVELFNTQMCEPLELPK